MGTNYYAVVNPCETCGRGDAETHIGKTSMGWVPLFRAYGQSWERPQATSWEDWKEYLTGGPVGVKDEYGKTIPVAEFIERMEDRMRSGDPSLAEVAELRTTADGLPYRMYAGEFS